RRGRIGVGELTTLGEVSVPHVADRGDPHAGDLGERVHQLTTPPTGADASDLDRVVGGIPSRCFGRRQERSGAQGTHGLNERTAGFLSSDHRLRSPRVGFGLAVAVWYRTRGDESQGAAYSGVPGVGCRRDDARTT